MELEGLVGLLFLILKPYNSGMYGMIDMEGLKEVAKKLATEYLYRYGDCDKAINSAKNYVKGYYRALTEKEIPEDFLDELEDQLRKELGCL